MRAKEIVAMKQPSSLNAPSQLNSLLNGIAGVYFCTIMAGVLALFLSFGLEFLPSAALRIAVGLLTSHAVLVGLSKHRGRAVTWLPFGGSLGAFLLFVLFWGLTMKVNEGFQGSMDSQVAERMYETAKTMLSYALPVLLSLMGLLRTWLELDPNS